MHEVSLRVFKSLSSADGAQSLRRENKNFLKSHEKAQKARREINHGFRPASFLSNYAGQASSG